MRQKYCWYRTFWLTLLCSIFCIIVLWNVSHTYASDTWSLTNTTTEFTGQSAQSTWFFTITNPHLLRKLTSEQRTLMIARTRAYVSTFIKTVYDMQNRGFITASDVALLDKKVQLEYVNWCDSIDGKISIKQRYRNGTWTRNELLGINLHINICFQKSFTKQLPTYINQVIVHELGHFIYYFDDIAPYNFQMICWDKWARKATCKKDSFVSLYAMTNEEEDYAESFAARYLKTFPDTKNAYLLQKKAYFDKLWK